MTRKKGDIIENFSIQFIVKIVILNETSTKLNNLEIPVYFPPARRI